MYDTNSVQGYNANSLQSYNFFFNLGLLKKCFTTQKVNISFQNTYSTENLIVTFYNDVFFVFRNVMKQEIKTITCTLSTIYAISHIKYAVKHTI